MAFDQLGENKWFAGLFGGEGAPNPAKKLEIALPESAQTEKEKMSPADIEYILAELDPSPAPLDLPSDTPIADSDAPIELMGGKETPIEHTKNELLRRAHEAYAQFQETTDTVRFRMQQKKYSLLLKLGLTAEQRQNARELVAAKREAKPNQLKEVAEGRDIVQREILETRITARMKEVKEQIAKLDEQIEHTSLFGPKTLSYSFKRMLPMFARNLNNESYEKSMAVGELEAKKARLEAKKARLAEQLQGLKELHGRVLDTGDVLTSLDALRDHLGV